MATKPPIYSVTLHGIQIDMISVNGKIGIQYDTFIRLFDKKHEYLYLDSFPEFKEWCMESRKLWKLFITQTILFPNIYDLTGLFQNIAYRELICAPPSLRIKTFATYTNTQNQTCLYLFDIGPLCTHLNLCWFPNKCRIDPRYSFRDHIRALFLQIQKIGRNKNNRRLYKIKDKTRFLKKQLHQDLLAYYYHPDNNFYKKYLSNQTKQLMKWN